MSREIKTIDEFKEVIQETCLVDFYTDNCPNCKIMSPIIDSLESEIPIYKFKLDDKIATAISDVCRVMAAPTMIIFKGGVECFRTIGFTGKSELEDIISVYK